MLQNTIADSHAIIKAAQFAEVGLWLARARGDAMLAQSRAKAAGADRAIVATLKALSSGMSVANNPELADYANMALGFTRTLATDSVFDRLLPDTHAAPFRSRYGVLVQHTDATRRREGRASTVSRAMFTAGTLEERTTSALIVLSREMQRFAHAPELFETALREGLARSLNSEFLADVSLGAASLAATGLAAAGIRDDLRFAAALLPTRAASKLHLAVPTAVCKRMSLMPNAAGDAAFPGLTLAGGDIAALAVTATDELTADALLIDADALTTASAEIELRASDQATIEMASDPSNATQDDASPVQPVEATGVSLFQTDSVALGVLRRWAFDILRAPCVRITGVTSWGLNPDLSPPA